MNATQAYGVFSRDLFRATTPSNLDRGALRQFAESDGTTRASSLCRLVVQAPARAWRQQVEERMQNLIRLPVGWDGYRGQPVNFECANFAIRMLESICPTGAPVPHLVPGTEGDIQIEWHTDSGDIELHVRRPNSVHAWRQTEATGDDGEEIDLTVDFRPILSWIKELSESAADDNSAAA